MYQLYKVGDLYQIHSSFIGDKAMEGTLLAIMTYAVTYLRFDADELEKALMDMLENDRDAAHFNGNRVFTVSFNKMNRAG